MTRRVTVQGSEASRGAKKFFGQVGAGTSRTGEDHLGAAAVKRALTELPLADGTSTNCNRGRSRRYRR